ncbi:MAG TPA: SDR family oxidoreductase [Solirubrobacterales bacterium]|nr:SDR family oxidoreductase [Solirubrobacterales bacterium]
MESQQRVALVSGSNRGIGREIARQLGELGHRVIVTARDPAAARRTVEELSDGGRLDLQGEQLDVADAGSVERLGKRLEEEPGRLDALVNNAGDMGQVATNVSQAPLDDAHRTMETNLFGAWRLVQATLPLLRHSGHGRIVNVSSGAGQLSDMNGGYPGYRISKTALNALTRILSNEEGANGILVNSMCPGWVRTQMGGSAAPRSVAEGADTAVWLATLPDDGPQGGFFRNRNPIPW